MSLIPPAYDGATCDTGWSSKLWEKEKMTDCCVYAHLFLRRAIVQPSDKQVKVRAASAGAHEALLRTLHTEQKPEVAHHVGMDELVSQKR